MGVREHACVCESTLACGEGRWWMSAAARKSVMTSRRGFDGWEEALSTTDLGPRTGVDGGRVYLPLGMLQMTTSSEMSCGVGACAIPDRHGRFWSFGISLFTATEMDSSLSTTTPVMGCWVCNESLGRGVFTLERMWMWAPELTSELREWVNHVVYDNPEWVRELVDTSKVVPFLNQYGAFCKSKSGWH